MANGTAGGEVCGMFDQAFRALGDSVKVTMKAQEDTVKLWCESVGKVGPVQAMAGGFLSTAQKNAQEYLRLLESSYRRSADLLRKIIQEQGRSEGISAEKRTREWWEASMEVMRENAQDLAGTNMRIAQSWTEVFHKSAEQSQEFARQGAQVAQRAAQISQQTFQPKVAVGD